ncbi:DsbA family protein [Methylocella sp.]|uniref:DsbA family protein n=1 Tax=Methylocella sp. TaxID=1978226 RepID=UPI003784A70A
MTLKRLACAALACLSLVAGAPARAAEFSPAQKSEIESIVKSYLVQNPDVLREAAAALEARERHEEAKLRQSVIGDPASPLFSGANQAVIGNPDGKITLVEFFDFNCGYCKRALGDLGRLMKDNPDLRVILRDLPILREESIQAAKIASAATQQLQGAKYWDFHQRLLGMRSTVGKGEALSAARDAGLDLAKLEKDAAGPDVQKAIAQSEDLARQLNISGTPSYVIGDEVVVGAVGYAELQAKIANVRKCGKSACS